MIKILLVEDEFLIANCLRVELQQEGYLLCTHASTGEDALRIASREHPHLILMDIGLSGAKNGIETAREIHQNLNIPIVFISGYNDPEILSQAQSLNPLGYLVKPFSPAALTPLISTILGNPLP